MSKENTASNIYTKDEQAQIHADIQAECERIKNLPEHEVRQLLAETTISLKWLQKSVGKMVDAVGFMMELQSDTVHTINKVINNEPVIPIAIGGSPEEVRELKTQTNI